MLSETALHQDDEIRAWLRGQGVSPTSQRLDIARVFFSRFIHLSAEDVFRLVNTGEQRVSKATVYNTLSLFVEKGLIRQVVADPNKIFYDSNTAAHHHFFDVDTGELADIDSTDLKVSGLPTLPDGKALEGVDVVVRVRRGR
jgi:Fur family transcriptional regulator, iron response regulator